MRTSPLPYDMPTLEWIYIIFLVVLLVSLVTFYIIALVTGRKDGFTWRGFGYILLPLGILFIAYLTLHSREITPADWAQILLMGGLVMVTSLYAFSALRQADASVKMAREMKEQRYDTVRPIIDIQRQLGDQVREGLAARSEELSNGLLCILSNIGVGPAIDVYSYIQINSERNLWAFGTLSIGEATCEKKLSLEHTSDRMVLVAYYKDVYGRDFESRREVTLDTERNGWKIGPLEIEVKKVTTF